MRRKIIQCTYLSFHHIRYFSNKALPVPLRSKKSKSNIDQTKHFVDVKRVRAIGGSGGDGCISYLQLWANEKAGPDGGDGGSGGHVLLKASENVRGLERITSVLKGEDGEKGTNKGCTGKNGAHKIIPVPLGTLVYPCTRYKEIEPGDLDVEGSIFILARGGSGGKGNSFFASSTNQKPEVAEIGALGEDLSYILEVRTIASFGLLGMPNAGKSTLLQAITRAKPKVASYPFTTLKPFVGMVQYDDYVQIPVADLPGLIEGSHQNRGLGIGFLRHAQRCAALVVVVDASSNPLEAVKILRNEVSSFSHELKQRPWFVIANKVDLHEAKDNLVSLRDGLAGVEVVPISAKFGTNLSYLLKRLRELYDTSVEENNLLNNP